jgi:hypothetical protein
MLLAGLELAELDVHNLAVVGQFDAPSQSSALATFAQPLGWPTARLFDKRVPSGRIR